jgi:glycosyltransferase involved in cell wall biosynthesis
VRHEFGVPLDSPLFIDVGRIGAEKNQLKAVSVVSMLEALEGAAHLLLVGRRDATYEKRILSLAAERGFDDRILFAGVRNDVPRLLRGSDALIFPSLREGLPGVVLEACAAGIPVVASDLPGIVEIARYFNTVVPISPASSDADWATAVNRTLGMKVAPDVAIDRFLGTPFAIEQSVARLSILWSGGQTIAAH